MSTLYVFLSGGSVFGFFICALLFASFWWRSHDDLFIAFAIAFALLGTGQAVQILADIPDENRSYIYLFRLTAFAIILIAVGRKNFRAV